MRRGPDAIATAAADALREALARRRHRAEARIRAAVEGLDLDGREVRETAENRAAVKALVAFLREEIAAVRRLSERAMRAAMRAVLAATKRDLVRHDLPSGFGRGTDRATRSLVARTLRQMDRAEKAALRRLARVH